MEPLPDGYFVTAEAPMEGLGRRAAVKGDGRVSSGDSRLLTSLQLTEVSLSMIKGSTKFAFSSNIIRLDYRKLTEIEYYILS